MDYMGAAAWCATMDGLAASAASAPQTTLVQTVYPVTWSVVAMEGAMSPYMEMVLVFATTAGQEISAMIVLLATMVQIALFVTLVVTGRNAMKGKKEMEHVFAKMDGQDPSVLIPYSKHA